MIPEPGNPGTGMKKWDREESEPVHYLLWSSWLMNYHVLNPSAWLGPTVIYSRIKETVIFILCLPHCPRQIGDINTRTPGVTHSQAERKLNGELLMLPSGVYWNGECKLDMVKTLTSATILHCHWFLFLMHKSHLP